MKLRLIIAASLLASFGAHSNAQIRFVESDAPQRQTAQSLSTASGRAAADSSLSHRSSGTFDVEKSDTTVRQTLSRWSIAAGWTFAPEHWTLGRDHPIMGTAPSLGDTYIEAVRALLSTTEMTDLHVQPCFYSNRVLRVIPISETCSR